VLPLSVLRTLHSHAEATRGAAASGHVAVVHQVLQAGGVQVLLPVDRDLTLVGGTTGVVGVTTVEQLLRAGQTLVRLFWQA
jgi:hypothetical protein